MEELPSVPRISNQAACRALKMLCLHAHTVKYKVLRYLAVELVLAWLARDIYLLELIVIWEIHLLCGYIVNAALISVTQSKTRVWRTSAALNMN